MPVSLVVGLQWGDEGKGRIVDAVAGGASVAARFGGGANAGHTVRVGDKIYKLRVVPSGVVAGVRDCVIGPGTVVSPSGFAKEIGDLAAAGVDTSRVWVSDLAHLIMPYHIALDRATEARRGGDALGTTGNGIGPAYMDRVARIGIRAGDLWDNDAVTHRVRERVAALRAEGVDVYEDAALAEVELARRMLLPQVRDTVTLIDAALSAGERVLVEGAQGTLLDVTFGTYPYVTSSVTVAGGAPAGLGFSPREIEHVIGVVKAYATRVGGGPFPTELHNDVGDGLRARGKEFGTVTGRPRRCGWLDLAALRYAVRLNGATHLAITKLDVLDELHELQVCVSYEGEGMRSLPLLAASGARPEYRRMPGWRVDTSSCRRFEELPTEARDYVKFIEDAAEVPVAFVSVGPERSQLVVRPGAPLVPAAVAS